MLEDDSKRVGLTEKECEILFDRIQSANIQPGDKAVVESIITKLEQAKNPAFSKHERQWLANFTEDQPSSPVLNGMKRKFRVAVEEVWQAATDQLKDFQIDSKIEAMRETIEILERRIEELLRQKSAQRN